ncbi:MAG: 2-amino-4-hydroxy-6-hydroxymethyldihydropteridine diphosphokinase [Acidobacteriota bacterium]
MEQVLIGFGSNMGDSVRICREAVEMFRRHPLIEVLRVSSLYRTKPVGFIDQPWFINGAIACETKLEPEELLDVTLGIERDFGRVREIHWGPRTLDLDILLFGSRLMDLPRLTLPHPRLHERLFVLAPLSEIAPEHVHPSLGLTVRELLADFLALETGQEIERFED